MALLLLLFVTVTGASCSVLLLDEIGDKVIICNVPLISGCTLQWYDIILVPVLALISAPPEDPPLMIPVSKEPSSAVAVCGELSMLFQVTVDPLLTDAGFGL